MFSNLVHTVDVIMLTPIPNPLKLIERNESKMSGRVKFHSQKE